MAIEVWGFLLTFQNTGKQKNENADIQVCFTSPTPSNPEWNPSLRGCYCPHFSYLLSYSSLEMPSKAHRKACPTNATLPLRCQSVARFVSVQLSFKCPHPEMPSSAQYSWGHLNTPMCIIGTAGKLRGCFWMSWLKERVPKEPCFLWPNKGSKPICTQTAKCAVILNA